MRCPSSRLRVRPAMREAPDPLAIGPTERALAMRHLPGAGALDPAALAALGSVARARQLAPREPLQVAGRAVGLARVLVSGALASSDGRSGGEATDVLAFLSGAPAEASWFGGPRGAVVLEISREDLEDVIDEVPAVLVALAAHVGSRALALGERSERAALSALPRALPSRPLDLVERLIALKRCAALSGVEIDALFALAEACRELKIAPAASAWVAGSRAAALLVIVAGELEVRGPHGAARLGAGDMAGEAEVLARARWRSTALASSPTLALVLPRDRLLDLWEDHPAIGLALVRNVAGAILAAHRAGFAPKALS